MIHKTIIITLGTAAVLTLVLGTSSHWVSTNCSFNFLPGYVKGSLVGGFHRGTMGISYVRRIDPADAGQGLDWECLGICFRRIAHTLDPDNGTFCTSALLTPFWLASLLLGAYPLVVTIRHTARRRRERQTGRCRKCGYNLTGNVTGTCPECGASLDPVDVPAVVPSARANDPAGTPHPRRIAVRRCALTVSSLLAIVTLLFGSLSYWGHVGLSALLSHNTGAWQANGDVGFTNGEASFFCCPGGLLGLKGPHGYDYWELALPFWIPALIFGFYPTVVLLRWLKRRRQARAASGRSAA